MKVFEMGGDEWAFDDAEVSEEEFDVLDTAIGLCQMSEFTRAEQLLKLLVQKYPENIDGYHHLSMLYADTGRELEAYLCAREAARIGLDALPAKFNWKKSQLSWYAHSNRPFLRAYHALGLWHESRNELDAAIEVFSKLLKVCPSDNLGVRYLLPKLWLDKGDFLSVVRLCKANSDDPAPEITYSYPLALALMGEADKAARLLAAAEEKLPLVAKELRKKRHRRPRSASPDYITHGGADQAYVYWQQYGRYWMDNGKALALLGVE